MKDRPKLRLIKSFDRSFESQFPVLNELVEHAEHDLKRFEVIQEGQPEEVAKALRAAQTAVNGLATVLDRHKQSFRPEA